MRDCVAKGGIVIDLCCSDISILHGSVFMFPSVLGTDIWLYMHNYEVISQYSVSYSFTCA